MQIVFGEGSSAEVSMSEVGGLNVSVIVRDGEAAEEDDITRFGSLLRGMAEVRALLRFCASGGRFCVCVCFCVFL